LLFPSLSLFNSFLLFFPEYLRKSLELFEKETHASRDLTSKSNSSTCAPRLELSSNSTALPPKSAQISLLNEKLRSIEGDIRAQQARACGVKTQERSGAKKTQERSEAKKPSNKNKSSSGGKGKISGKSKEKGNGNGAASKCKLSKMIDSVRTMIQQDDRLFSADVC
jgi:hypothetical protein